MGAVKMQIAISLSNPSWFMQDFTPPTPHSGLTSVVLKVSWHWFRGLAHWTRVVYAMLAKTKLTEEPSTLPMLPWLNSHLATLQAFEVSTWLHQKLIAFTSTVHFLAVVVIVQDTPCNE